MEGVIIMKFKNFVKKHHRLMIALFFAFIVWFFFAFLTIQNSRYTRTEIIELDTSRSLNQYSLVLGNIFSDLENIETFVLTKGIDNISESDFMEFAENHSFDDIGFVSFSIAPNGVVEHYYSEEFDDSLVGHDFINDERQEVRESVQYAIENKVVIVNGPFDLLIGDLGIVFRKPIYDNDEFVGLIGLVVHVDELYSHLHKEDTDRIVTGVFDKNNNLVFGEQEPGGPLIHKTQDLNFEYVEWHIGVQVTEDFDSTQFLLSNFLGVGFTLLIIVIMTSWIFYYIKNNRLLFEQNKLIYYDVLSGLPNRMLFEEQTTKLINQQVPFLLGFGDLDNFKNINDVLGHSVGDQYLSFVTSHLSELISDNLRIYRWGGDEFIFIFLDTDKNHLSKTMEHIFEIFKKPFEVKETKHQISISIGVVEFPLHGSNLDDLVKRADIVMYDIKAQYKNTYSFFEQKYLDDLVKQHEFQQALDKYTVDDFDVYLQPIIDVSSGKVRGFEGLARLFSDDGIQFSTYEIIKLYEQDGTITKLDKFVFHRICTYIHDCQKIEKEGMFFTFNISPLSLTTEYIDYIEMTVHSYNIDPNTIVIEIIETLGFKDVKISIEMLERIKRIGFKIAMDDFGMGYSSLSYITKLPLNIIKIDRSFIHDYETNTFNRTILNTIKDISNSLHLEVLVEGVETQGQLDFITQLGAQYYQGYLHSKPMSYEKMKKFIRNQKE